MGFRTSTPREGYHHGNLREAMVQAALDMIRERGPGGFSFAEVARAVGVSGAAPYRHFRDRNALVAEIARQGFLRLEAELLRAWADGKPTASAAIDNAGRAYLNFARREPAAYAAMFHPGFAIEEDADLSAAYDRAFAIIRRAAERVTAAVPGMRKPPALMVALHIWSLAHGIASLYIGDPNGTRRRLPMTPEELLEAGLLIYLQSLGAPAP
jgi:AcrR family transcriptional regulator